MERLDPGAAAWPTCAAPARALRQSEWISALSHALDITEGQPKGHCVRCCWIGMHIAQAIGLGEKDLWALYYTLLLKDLGCSSNAARICELYLTDDLQFKHDFKTVGDSLPRMLRFVFTHTGLGAGMSQRPRAVLNIMRNGPQIVHELTETRCQRGADIARRLRFPDAVALGIHSLDEHWNGRRKPQGLAGEAIPLPARIALLAQVVDVFRTASGPQPALQEVRNRVGRWFDPALLKAFEGVAGQPAFWAVLDSPNLDQAVLALEPVRLRVALYVDHMAGVLGLSATRRRWLKRGALLHDVGKLGVSNAVLEKSGKLDTAEWAQVQAHARHTEAILSRIGAFAELASVSAAHHERLDGGGYPHGLQGDAISLETRIITVADIFDAISAERPYRGAVPAPQTLEIMADCRGQRDQRAVLRSLEGGRRRARHRRAERWFGSPLSRRAVRGPGSRFRLPPALRPCVPETASRR